MLQLRESSKASGVIDLIRMQAIVYDEETLGDRPTALNRSLMLSCSGGGGCACPTARSLSENDDAFMMKYLRRRGHHSRRDRSMYSPGNPGRSVSTGGMWSRL